MPIALPELKADSTLSDVRNAQVVAARILIELRSTPKEKRGDAHAADVTDVANFIQDTDLIEKGLTAGERAARDQEDAERRERESDRERRSGRGPRGHAANLDPEDDWRSMGRQTVDGDAFGEWVKRGGRSAGPFMVEVRNLLGGYTTGAYDSGADGLLPVGSPVMVPGSIQRRRMFVRDLASVQSTGLRVVPYVRETNQVTNETGAQMVSEGSAKPEVTAQFENYSAIVEKIAAWIPATDEIMTDAPTLRGYIDTRLEYMLDIREEQQELGGNGTSPQLQGLATLSGTQTQPMVTGLDGGVTGDYSATIGMAMGLVENVDGEADGVVTNPIDYWTAITKRHVNQFDNGFGAGAPGTAGGPGGVTWGQAAVRTRALTAGTAWVGSWKLGMTVFDRQQTTIKVGDQHSDYLIRNLLVILAERRVAVAWHRPNLFVKCTVPTTHAG